MEKRQCPICMPKDTEVRDPHRYDSEPPVAAQQQNLEPRSRGSRARQARANRASAASEVFAGSPRRLGSGTGTARREIGLSLPHALIAAESALFCPVLGRVGVDIDGAGSHDIFFCLLAGTPVGASKNIELAFTLRPELGMAYGKWLRSSSRWHESRIRMLERHWRTGRVGNV